MTNYQKFKITDKEVTKEFNSITFKLDRGVSYTSNGYFVMPSYIFCVDCYPFNTCQVGDYLEIDIEKTIGYHSGHEFNDTSIVRKVFSQADLDEQVLVNKELSLMLNSFCQRMLGKKFIYSFSRSDLSSCQQKLNEIVNKFDESKREKNSLEKDRDDWKTRFRNENSKYEDYKKKYEKAIKDLGDERTNHANIIASEKLRHAGEKSVSQVENTELRERLESSNAQNIELKKQLEDAKNELGLVRVAKDNQEIALISKIDQKQLLLEAVRQSLADLRVENERELAEKDIEINEKSSQLREKDTELHRKEEEINNLRNQKGLSHEELLNEKLTSKKRSLELFATELKIDLEQIHSLTKYHERLFLARKNHNWANIDIHEANITRVKQEFQNAGISIVNIQEICEKCERVAELLWELEQTQQQYEARQEVPTNIFKNMKSCQKNFTKS